MCEITWERFQDCGFLLHFRLSRRIQSGDELKKFGVR